MRRATGAQHAHVDGHVISIHALHEESDRWHPKTVTRSARFQSTLSMRRATTIELRTFDCWHISIHALHEESDRHNQSASRPVVISIHALHEESDAAARPVVCSHEKFQSTLSMRRATSGVFFEKPPHRTFQSTLSMRRATCSKSAHSPRIQISIHALHEESDGSDHAGCPDRAAFQSTLSMRRATHSQHKIQKIPQDFNPRSP